MNDPTAPTSPVSAAGERPALPLAALAAAAVPVLLAGCGGGGGGAAAAEASGDGQMLTITAIEVRGTSDTAGNPVTVNTIAQPEPTGALRFSLSGGIGALKLPADPGRSAGTQDYDFAVRQSGASGRDVTVTINPAPTAVIGAVTATVFDRARHLAARTGFGASWDDLQALLGLSHDEAVERMVDHAALPPQQSPPGAVGDGTLETWVRRRKIKEWWLREIVDTANPFSERLTLFWSNHFVVNVDDTDDPRMAWNWLKFLRDHCVGNFKSFVHAMAMMPAMVVYLNNDTNTKTSPNENFARELMELFTLGEGKVYTEEDVIQVARAFTGYGIDDHKAWLYTQSKHDTGTSASDPIVVMGITLANLVPTDPPAPGSLAGDEVLDIILEAGKVGGVPRAARFVVEKLWAEFIGAPPAPPAAGDPPSTAYTTWLGRIDYFAGIFYASGGAGAWELKPLLKAFFKSADFTAAANIGTMLKAPMELIGGFFRSLDLTPNRWDWKVYDCGGEEQDPLSPPNVRGWLGGTAWINAKTLLERTGHMNGYQWEVGDAIPLAIREGYEDFMLARKSDRRFAPPAIPSWMTDPRQQLQLLLRALIQDPAYQMK
jgi:uncharacterized protein (DUF1800 family)